MKRRLFKYKLSTCDSSYSVSLFSVSSQRGDLDSLEFWVIVLVPETLSLESVNLHLVVVESADGVNVWSCGQLLQEVLGVV